MKQIIIKYLDSNYQFTLSTYSSYKLFDKINKTHISLNEVLKSIQPMFSVDEGDVNKIFDYWAENKVTELQNKIVDIRHQLYKKTGFLLELSIDDLNKLVIAEENKLSNTMHYIGSIRK